MFIFSGNLEVPKMFKSVRIKWSTSCCTGSTNNNGVEHHRPCRHYCPRGAQNSKMYVATEGHSGALSIDKCVTTVGHSGALSIDQCVTICQK